MAAPCVHAGGLLAASQTTASWVSELRPGAPRHWATGTAAPCVSLFKPVSVDQPLDLGRAPDDRADPESLWWRHEAVHRRLLARPERLAAPLLAERDALERRWLAEPPPSEVAFKEGDALLGRWRQQLEPGRDRRPRFVRRYWALRDRRAGLAVLLLWLALLPLGARAQSDLPPVAARGCVGCLAEIAPSLSELFSEQEWRELSRGDVLVAHEQGDGSPAGTTRAAGLIPHSPEQVWSVVTDFEMFN